MRKEPRQILLIDDDENLRCRIEPLLRHAGYGVWEAGTAEQGLGILSRGTPDLILLDMNMPGMGGIAFLKQLASADSPAMSNSIPVLVLTGRAELASFFDSVKVDGFVAKPCKGRELLDAVTSILGQQQSNESEDEGRGVILLGEDDHRASEAIQCRLSDLGYAVRTASQADESLLHASTDTRVVLLQARLIGLVREKYVSLFRSMAGTRDCPIVIYDGSGSPCAASMFGARFSPNIKAMLTLRDGGAILTALEDGLKDASLSSTFHTSPEITRRALAGQTARAVA